MSDEKTWVTYDEGEGKGESLPVPIAKTEASIMVSPTDINPLELKQKLANIIQFQALVQHELIKDIDFGVIPGTKKPTLLKPGAEKIIKLLNLADTYIIEDKVEDWEKGFFYYRVKCRLISLVSNQVISEGLGSCNSKESRYRWRWVGRSEVPEHLIDGGKVVPGVLKRQFEYYGKMVDKYRIENDDIYTIVNTLQKISKKRSLVDAALSVGRLSNLFTQDLDDIDLPEEKTEAKGSFPTTKTLPKTEPSKNINGTKDAPPTEAREDKGKVCVLVLSDGSKVKATRYDALEYFQLIKGSLKQATGDDNLYYSMLGVHGFTKSNEIPLVDMPKVWESMVQAWKDYAKEDKDE